MTEQRVVRLATLKQLIMGMEGAEKSVVMILRVAIRSFELSGSTDIRAKEHVRA